MEGLSIATPSLADLMKLPSMSMPVVSGVAGSTGTSTTSSESPFSTCSTSSWEAENNNNNGNPKVEPRIGDLLVAEGDAFSPFLQLMKAHLEKAVEEKERREREEAKKKKRERLENKITQLRILKENQEVQLFMTAGAAVRHDKKTHKKPEKGQNKEPIACGECGKMFASAFQLKEHVSILHLHERKFECEICGQKFGRRGGVRRHVQMVHLNQLHRCPYENCEHPGYKCSKALAAHIRSVHTNQRPYECEECGKNFVRRNDLKMHQMTHNEQPTFHCPCGSSFRRALYLRKHQKTCAMGGANTDEPDSSSVDS